MRKLILLSSVFMLSFGVLMDNDAYAIGDEARDSTLQETNRIIVEYLARHAEQLTATAAEQTDAAAQIANAQSTNASLNAQQTAAAGVAMSNSNTAEALCPALSAVMSDSAVKANADRAAEAFYQSQLSCLKGEPGCDSEFGVIDQARKKYAKRKGTIEDIDV